MRKARKRMAVVNYEKMSVKELTEHIAKAQKALSNAKERERSEVKMKIASLAENAGFSVGELFGSRGRSKAVAVKFMNPDNRSETWTGRGRKPNWLVAKLSKGAKLTDFAV
jgi:DNA-binding protein H-NS